MNDDLHDLFRGMASEGPTDEGLLDGVHAAAARAAVRRRVIVSSAAAVALLVVGIGVVSVSGSDGPRVHDQVFGASGQPTAQVTGSPTLAPSPEPSAGAPVPSVPPTGTYRGRAVSVEGKPVAGLYVYALPQGFPEVEAFHQWLADNRPVTQTHADGTFTISCPRGPVLLTSWPFHLAQDESTPNWAAVFVGGASAPSDSTVPRCRNKVETTHVAQGAVVQGAVAGPGLLCPSTHNLVAAFGTDEDSIFSLVLSNAWTHEAADGTFRIAGLPVGTYWVAAFSADPEESRSTGYARAQVEVGGTGVYEVELAPTRDDEDSSCPAPTPGATESPGPDPVGEPNPTPAPSPSA